MTNLLYWLLAILMFGVLVTLHEFGHFIAARICGVPVVEFAVGFGPKLLSHKARSGVRYSLRLLPFGGYCRFYGEDGAPTDETEETQGDPPRIEGAHPGEDSAQPAEQPLRPFPSEKIWKRALISIAGPLMNVLTAIVLLFLLYFIIGLPIGTEPVVDGLIDGLPARTAGFEVGDRILQINGVDIDSTAQASTLIEAAGNSDIDFTLERDGTPIAITLRPQWVEDETPPRYMIGIQYRMGSASVTFGFVDSVQNAVLSTGEMAGMIVSVLRDLITTGEGLDELSGPIGTVTLVKEQTQQGGIFQYLYLASIISVNLGLFNLLPIPGLDGSKLLFLAIEKIRGKPMDPNKEGIVTLIGFSLLIGLMVLVMYQDIMRLIR